MPILIRKLDYVGYFVGCLNCPLMHFFIHKIFIKKILRKQALRAVTYAEQISYFYITVLGSISQPCIKRFIIVNMHLKYIPQSDFLPMKSFRLEKQP